MRHTPAPASGAVDDERLGAVLDGLRAIADTSDPAWRPRVSDARAILEGAWAALADLLEDRPNAGAVIELLRRLTVTDDALVRATGAPRRLGEALGRLESAPSTVADLVTLSPQLTRLLGFDRAIFSSVVDGVWTSESTYVLDDPQWADEINRAGKSAPQQLVPGMPETEIVRRREPMIVTDVQRDPRVHRPIADASRSKSYVAAPIMAGNRVVGLLHGDCYLQGRDPDTADSEALVAYARGLQLALSRARAAEQLQSVGAALGKIANDCLDGVVAIHDFSLEPADEEKAAELPLAARVTRQALKSVRDLLTAREVQILELMANGLSNSRIAEQLVISEGTVKQHVKHVLRKLRAANRVEAVSMLYQSDRA